MLLVQLSVQWYWSQFHDKSIYLALELPLVESKRVDERQGKKGMGINKSHAYSTSGLLLGTFHVVPYLIFTRPCCENREVEESTFKDHLISNHQVIF